MPTVPNLPAASAVASTDHLWLTQGTGTARDKKATVAQIGDAGHKALAFGDASAVAATDKVFLVQGSGADKDKMAVLPAVVGAGLPGAMAALGAADPLDGTEFFPMVTAAGVAFKASPEIVGRRIRHDFEYSEITALRFGSGGADVLLSTVTGVEGKLAIAFDYQLQVWDMSIGLYIPLQATTGHYAVGLAVPVSAFPTDLQSLVRGSYPLGVGTAYGSLLKTVAQVLPVVDVTPVNQIRYEFSSGAAGGALNWDDVATPGSSGVYLTASLRVFA